MDKLMLRVMAQHPINRMFLLDALHKLVNKVSEIPMEELEVAFLNHDFVSARAWREAAETWKKELKKLD